MEYTREQLQEKFLMLPEVLREFILSFETAKTVGNISERNNLSEAHSENLASQVGLVLMKFIPKERFTEQLVSELSLPPEQAQGVALEVEKEIFAKVPSSFSPLPLTKGEKPPIGGEGVGSTTTKSPPPPPSQARGTPPYQGGEVKKQLPTPPRPVPIRKPAPPPPPRQSSGQATTTTLQTILADIRRGTAYDERRIEEAFRKTPIEVRQTLESVGFLSRLENIAKKFGLNVEETGELVSESGLVMLGLTLPVQFVDNLAKRLRLPRVQAMAVGQAVNMEVLRPVREILRKMGQPTEIKPPPPPSQARSTPPYQGGEAEGVGLRFAPSVSTHSASAPFPRGSAEQSEAKGWNSVQKPPPPPSQARGTPPYQGGEGNKQSGYTTDPYREPLE